MGKTGSTPYRMERTKDRYGTSAVSIMQVMSISPSAQNKLLGACSQAARWTKPSRHNEP
jgi:hypothetical protein